MHQSIKTDCNVQEENMDTMIPYIQNKSEHLTFLTLKEMNDSEAKILVPVTVLCVIVMVLGIIGNTFVIIVHKVRPTRIYIVCLAALDITTCVVGIPYHVLDLMNPYTYFYPLVCKLLTFLITLPMTASMFILAIVAIDRYLKLCKPLRSQQTNLESIRTCLIVLSCSLVVVSPYILIYGHRTIHVGVENVTGSQCFIDESYEDSLFPLVYIGFQLLLFVIVTLVLIVLYIIIWRAVIKQEKYYNRLYKSANTNHRIFEIKSTFLRLPFCMRLRDNRRQAAVETDDEKACATQLKAVVQLDVAGNDMCHSCPNDMCHSCPKLTIHSPESVPKADIKSCDKSNFSKKNECMSKESTHCSSVIEAEGYSKKASLMRFQSGSAMGSRSQSDNSNYNSGTQHNHQHRTKLTKIMFTITFVFIMTYLPTFCISLLNITVDTFWDDMTNSERILYDGLLRFYLLNNMAKPFIYVVWDSRFRRKCIRLIKRLVCCSASNKGEDM